MLESGNRPERVIFVGGAPRSGTTLAQALLCTADEVGELKREISFYRGIVQGFAGGESVWDGHTSDHFETTEQFRALFEDLSRRALQPVWEAAGRPQVLCVKDPNLTPLFPQVARLLPEARFVTVARRPDEVIRSRMNVHEKQAGPGTFTKDMALTLAREYVGYYLPVLDTDFGDRHLSFRYDQIENPVVQRALSVHIGVRALHVDRLWGEVKEKTPAFDGPWSSPKLGQPIDTSSRFAPLPKDWIDEIYEIAARIVETYRFKRPAAPVPSPSRA